MSERISTTKITASRVVLWDFAAILGVVFLTTQQGDVLICVGGISALAVALFATQLLPEVVTALGCLLASNAFATASNVVVFSGYTTGKFWLFYAV